MAPAAGEFDGQDEQPCYPTAKVGAFQMTQHLVYAKQGDASKHKAYAGVLHFDDNDEHQFQEAGNVHQVM